ncbi:OPT oligopeptide transporter protein-domain-containing protein [Obelidium mucronatum]|nr:OPT oligopeptide transporter protein-domain-containing protein [Obelidium mucronatum]
MTTVEQDIAEKEKQVNDLVEAHPELEDDVELGDIKEVMERIDFIVPQSDDPNTPAFTFRSVFLGTFWVVLLSFANTALSFRTNAFYVNASVALILTYPLGLILAAILPSGILNPGPFSMKEHVLIYIIASCGYQPYGIENVVSQMMPDLMGNTDITFLQSLGFVIVTQFLGYGLSGLTRRFLVRPTAMWWPSTLSTIALFTSFHKTDLTEFEGVQKYSMTRYRFFWVAFIGMFVYMWIPEYFAPVLQTISLGCLLAGRGSGKSGVLSKFNVIAGSAVKGMGFLGLTFDWTYLGSYVFTTPFWAMLTFLGGTAFFQYLITPILWANDVWGDNLVIGKDALGNPTANSPSLFVGNKNGTKKYGARVKPNYFYNKSANYDLNLTAYNDVAPVRLTAHFALVYGASFATITAALSHVALWYGKDIYRQTMNAFRQVRDEVDGMDKHVKMMEAYPDVPDWAYLAFLAVASAGAIIVSLVTPFNMPWWAIFFNLFICLIFILPFGIVPAVSGFYLYLNVLTEFVIGLMIPGQTVAVMAFKSWGTNSLSQALTLTQDLKLGQYLHIPPYAMVFAQFYGTLVNAFVSTAAVFYMVYNTNDLLQKPEWRYNGHQTFYSAGGIWGAIGPQRFFGIGSLYEGLLWCFLIGATAPLLPWLANKYIYKSRYWHFINFAIIFTTGNAGAYQVVVLMPFLLALVSQYLFLKNKEFYQKYLYVMGAAFDGSAGIVSLIISFMSVAGISFTTFWALNPNTDNVPFDYYCYPGASYNDYDCSYYLNQGDNETALGVSCV